ncbi:MAG: hypothetical protein HC822_18895 [Oscillochloris sp.]|nr:hypothetical protein [Oscillochloris sp.]
MQNRSRQTDPHFMIRKAQPVAKTIGPRLPLSQAGRLLVVGGDLFVRTGLLTGFILITTRMATELGAQAGAAHQAIRQIWLFTALFLDAFAITGQSLVGFFLGAKQVAVARRVAALVCWWSVAVGGLLALVMVLGRSTVEVLLVPENARGLFGAAWFIAAIVQPLNALAFATDGVHWGTGDYAYLRNAMLVATPLSLLALMILARGGSDVAASLTGIWIATGFWTTVRAGLGLVRIWPGIGKSPLR